MPLALPFFAAFTVYGITSPYLPVLVRGLGYDPAIIGLLLGLFEVAGISGPFLLGRLSDRLGRYRPPLVLATLLILFSLLPLALLRHPAASALALIVMAVGLRSLIPLLDATATLSLGPTGDYGRVRTVGSISFVLMALFLQYTPVLKPDHPTAIIIWVAVASVATLASLAVLPDHDPAELKSRRAAAAVGGNAERSRSWDSVFIAGLVMIGLGRMAMAPVNSFFSLYIVEELHWDAVGLMWALSASSEIPVMFFSARLIRRFGAPSLLALSVVAVATRLAIYALFPNPVGVVVGQLLHSLCYGLFHPAAIAFVATSVPPERRALGMTMYLSLGVGLPTFLGSALGGVIVEAAGYRALFAIYIIFAAASLAVYFAARKILERPARA